MRNKTGTGQARLGSGLRIGSVVSKGQSQCFVLLDQLLSDGVGQQKLVPGQAALLLQLLCRLPTPQHLGLHSLDTSV